MIPILRTRDDVTAWREEQPGPVGLVPTMGALHAGHESLIRRAAGENERVIVSVFVNPTQFNNPDDLARYPRDLERDAGIIAASGGTAIYAPAPDVIYPEGFATSVTVSGVTEDYEGESRPGHFTGVATVVTILLNQVRADRAYFGEKDYQQLAMIRRLHADLALPGEIVPCPTVRDEDGLALSSRNARLTAAQRAAALVLSRSLHAMREHAEENRDTPLRLSMMGAVLISARPEVTLDYLEIVDPDTLEPLDRLVPGARALVAAEIGGVRLIDNLELVPR
jgi:pantoate--beta-alanine ligase